MDFINIRNNGTPKYQQLVDAILEGVENGSLKVNDKLPSLNALMKKFNLSQDTVLNAYNHLKSRGVISSSVGKGYFILNDNIIEKHKLFVLFDNFTLYKENLYNSLNQEIKEEGTVDLFFHHNNASLYKKLISDAVGNYTSYIIMSIEDPNLDKFLIESLPPKSVYLLDLASDKLKKKYPFVAQNFEKDVFKCLNSNINLIKKYSRIRFLNSSERPHILRIKKGLKSFSKNKNLKFNAIADITKSKILKGDLYFVINDRDLIKLIDKCKEEKLSIGQDIGIISYNETELKKVIHNGITTVSTDFKLMGKSIAQLVLTKSRNRIYNEASLHIRDSI
ncbi:GntR family transcriptional regulator [Marinilabilia rubra]|uniref:Transcriptional regulator n=1 Tax=Marinilabilia rubra TaxID=2162893 RepID=A0A2U2BC33_9BACT|nr:GntR family transcriptional regulator [Marinilabilia rubra]PWE00620.1 transcriptional regulator [Marinilabilia rubra]